MVVETPRDCVFQVSTTVRDLDENVIEYPKALRVIFNKETEDIRFNPLGGVKRSEVLEVMDAIEAFYEANASKVTGAKVRGIVRNYLKEEPDEQRGVDGLSGENLRGRAGGIYFIPAKNRASWRRFRASWTSCTRTAAPTSTWSRWLTPSPSARSSGATTSPTRRRSWRRRSRTRRSYCAASATAPCAPTSSPTTGRSYHAMLRRSTSYKDILEEEWRRSSQQREILKQQLDKLLG
jgi:hypothetical protein